MSTTQGQLRTLRFQTRGSNWILKSTAQGKPKTNPTAALRFHTRGGNWILKSRQPHWHRVNSGQPNDRPEIIDKRSDIRQPRRPPFTGTEAEGNSADAEKDNSEGITRDQPQ